MPEDGIDRKMVLVTVEGKVAINFEKAKTWLRCFVAKFFLVSPRSLISLVT